MKEQKNKNRFLTLFAFAFLFNVFGLIGLFLVDISNGLRSENMDDNWLCRLFDMFGISRINIGASNFFCFLVAYAVTLLLILSFVFYRTAKAKAIAKGREEKKFRGIYFGAAAAVFLLGWIFSLVLISARSGKVSHVFLIFVYFFLSAVIFSLIAALVYLLIWLLVRLIVSQLARPSASVEAEPVVQSATEGEQIFPGLTAIDKQYEGRKPNPVPQQAPCSLPELAAGFQAFLSERCALYYDLSMLRSFIAGMAASRLIILEGLSGTGKSSLPRYFSEYVGSKAFFAPVQSTWRDRTDVLGFYNDFSGVFKETNFLKCLYEAAYTPEKFNLMVLDEMNLSRVEYYFADFLSVLEYPSESWKVSLMPHVPESGEPQKLSEGAVVVPVNTWFIGTANKDDSTFTITDKVYDRAIVLDFNERNTRVTTNASPEPLSLAPGQLNRLFIAAWQTKENRMTTVDLEKFGSLAQFVYDTFEIQFGNRIMNQISVFVPVYVALGGTKEEAIDIMFSRKVLHKLEGRFEDYVKDGLLKLQARVAATYGPGVMASTETMIRRLLKKLV